jgi:capsular polysaccharide biosynthesis protein
MNPPPISSPPAKPSSGGCWLYSGIVIVTFFLVFMTACVITYMMPKKFESVAVVQVQPSDRLAQSISPHFFATEFEVIRAHLTLKHVVRNLHLTTHWNMSEDEAIDVLRSIISTRNILGTDLIEIKVKHTNQQQARNIAMEVFESYKKRREDKELAMILQSLQEMEKAVLAQSDLLEEKRKSRDIVTKRHLQDTSIHPEVDLSLPLLNQELAFQQELLERMREKLVEEKANQNSLSVIELHEEPLVPRFPVSPNVNLNLIMGASLGLLFGLLMALFVRLVSGRKILG